MRNGTGSKALGAAIAVLLIASGFAIYEVFQAPGSTTVVVVVPKNPEQESQGTVLVSVAMREGNAISPLANVSVGLSSALFPLVRLAQKTDSAGEASFTVATGLYGVSVTDPRFSEATQATVSQGNTTDVQVIVNRTAYLSTFSSLPDPTGSGFVGPWETMTLAVAPYPWTPTVFGSNNSAPASPPRFGQQVFLQWVSYFGFSVNSDEVEASVTSQTSQRGLIWLEIQPLSPFSTGGEELHVITYAASIRVTSILVLL